ncbi:MAG: hypothetical protein WBJ21_06160 [Burkholderiaceae bacterium]
MKSTSLTSSDFLVDPLSEISRRERRNLLVSSVLGFLTSSANLVPAKISVLGIEFGAINQSAYVYLLAAIVFYFLLAFLFMGATDYLNWELRYRQHNLEVDIADENWSREEQENHDKRRHLHREIRRIYRHSHKVAWWRVHLEFFLPLVVSAASIVSLLFKSAIM